MNSPKSTDTSKLGGARLVLQALAVAAAIVFIIPTSSAQADSASIISASRVDAYQVQFTIRTDVSTCNPGYCGWFPVAHWVASGNACPASSFSGDYVFVGSNQEGVGSQTNTGTAFIASNTATICVYVYRTPSYVLIAQLPWSASAPADPGTTNTDAYECGDAIDNDTTDDDDWGCWDDSPDTEQLTSSPAMDDRSARQIARGALARRYKSKYRNADDVYLRCKRVRRSVRSCRYGIIDRRMLYSGTIRTYYYRSGEKVYEVRKFVNSWKLFMSRFPKRAYDLKIISCRLHSCRVKGKVHLATAAAAALKTWEIRRTASAQ